MKQTKTVAIASEHYKMTDVDMTYFTYLKYNNTVDYYSQGYGSQFLSYFGIDTSLPLSQQQYVGSVTWRDHCAGEAEETVKQYLVLCETAYEAGVTLNDEDRAAIEKTLQSVRDSAGSSGMSVDDFVTARYGKGVSLAHMKKCCEIAALADKYRQILYDGPTYGTADLQAYYDAHKKDFDFVDYRSYTFNAEYGRDATENEKAAAIEKAKDDAGKFLAALQRGGDFVDLVLKIEPDLTRKEADRVTLRRDAQYAEGDTGNWLFDDETAVGDVTKFDDYECVTVYQMVTGRHRDDYKTVDVGHVYFYAAEADLDSDIFKEEADKFLAEFKKGEMTAARLEEMASSGNYTYAIYNGKLEQVCKVRDDVTDGWLFDPARKANDAEVLVSELNGVNLFLYLKENDTAWEIRVEAAKRNEDYKARYAALAAEHPVKVDEEVMRKVAA